MHHPSLPAEADDAGLRVSFGVQHAGLRLSLL